ncbi:hypothetical protein TREMEDRAFT_32601 [Tremella mesenterica DSM 1558]|uniref:uncharacterized protein n=1 Tax=Tremella mesenterica (strain ATCC 24925 / CBS 8224 / DSM 1558 / NBRC 9311 / NRRL Y-6157 / RJB 2259-6 / UBC 559-6) TaxID=578456 RepID=UPI0003F4999F|nr:uncharacterized protein TREMEDRAFT_32601 [Tremella mesenterica DSM 1558]EIW67895.1 hypothetical protein TREMEDRAFT_32601 [Tremella mesenterica DSM 1558]
MTVPRLLVVGGNGFLGSAICKAAVTKGWEVASMSSSGIPYKTPAGHSPKWTQEVQWHQADAFDPSTYADLTSKSTAVVHTLGVLLEDTGYKTAIKEGNVLKLLGSLAKGLGDGGRGLKGEKERRKGYEGMNRDSALRVLDTMLSSSEIIGQPNKSFVYISAADAFRPLIPNRYLATKRQAEVEITRRCQDAETKVRPVFLRPGLMYHPHIRPISTLPAFALSLTASTHDTLHIPLPFSPDSFFGGAAEALRTHPLHVDHVAEAAIKSIEDSSREGVVDVDTMRQWAGFGSKSNSEAAVI